MVTCLNRRILMKYLLSSVSALGDMDKIPDQKSLNQSIGESEKMLALEQHLPKINNSDLQNQETDLKIQELFNTIQNFNSQEKELAGASTSNDLIPSFVEQEAADSILQSTDLRIRNVTNNTFDSTKNDSLKEETTYSNDSTNVHNDKKIHSDFHVFTRLFFPSIIGLSLFFTFYNFYK